MLRYYNFLKSEMASRIAGQSKLYLYPCNQLQILPTFKWLSVSLEKKWFKVNPLSRSCINAENTL